MDLELAGKRALVTGGSGGIGGAIVSALVDEGVSVLLGYHSDSGSADALVAAARSRAGEVVAVCLDVADDSSVSEVFAGIEANGGLDILVNAAGVAAFAPLATTDDSMWARVLEINAGGTFRCMRAATRVMVPAGGGDILNIGSFVSRIGAYEGTAYAASKGAVAAMTRAAALELAGYGIRVNCLAPGRIDTAIRRPTTANYRDFLLSQTPLGRVGSAEEVAALAVMILSRRIEFLVGETIEITGGLHSVYLQPALDEGSGERDN